MDTGFFVAWIEAAARAVAAGRERLTELDAAIGDADHGVNLDRGFTAVREALAADPPATPGRALTLTGTTLIRKVGGASGPLYGTVFRQMGAVLGSDAETTPDALADALAAAVAAVERLGGAREGDKTMIDALAPASRALSDAVRAGSAFEEALDAAVAAAQEGARAAIPLRARKGRASYLGERSAGHEDPGAASSVLIVTALRAAASCGSR
ncbi:dihydroxyacetone kinase subunit L [Sphaerisporangium krabiense]|uniref:Dihydroxyacetone kinase-like protein n=1 Tax=Sphaerisporangium krabiense TaxID=763782 RepID=A0A7W9DS98_9ACTN|nr:dihydroxyacetone kinase subunit DhaL [Sphaerisporangium krabiense]MBB5629467.1 dihydroxyacetone kinase-like protein [Sphaerisporangium krabiense]GII65683.1 dihydroxyacetone kinase subunit L [Sphaerisporangium krabiense]